MKKEGPPYNATRVPQDELGKDWEDVPIISTRGNSKELLRTSFYLEPHEISVSKGLYGESEAGDFQHENPAEGADEDIDETLSDENVLISNYLLSRGDNVDQIVKAISRAEGTQGRNLLLKKAQEWQEQNDNSPFGKMRERVNKMTHHLREIEAHTPESMKERHERLLKYLEDVVQPALAEQLRFQNSEIGAVDNSDELRTVARQLYDEITKFDNDLVQSRQGDFGTSVVEEPVIETEDPTVVSEEELVDPSEPEGDIAGAAEQTAEDWYARFGEGMSDEELREEWKRSKQEHALRHAEYNTEAQNYYDSLKNKNFFKKLGTRIGVSLGVKPELPDELKAMRNGMFQATAHYNRVTKALLERRGRSRGETVLRTMKAKLEEYRQEKDSSPEAQQKFEEYEKKVQEIEQNGSWSQVSERYDKLFARVTLLNTFNKQLEIQQQATEGLAFKQSEFLKKHSKKISIGVAAVMGGLSAGATGGFMAVGRVLAGSAFSGFTTGIVDREMSARVEQAKEKYEADYKAEVEDIANILGAGRLPPETYEAMYRHLQSLYSKVDTATQERILVIIATALASTLTVGIASGIASSYDGVPDVPQTDDVPDTQQTEGADGQPQDRDAIRAEAEAKIAASEAAQAAAGDAPQSSPSQGAEAAGDQKVAPEKSTAYDVKKGDNFWDIMEGQTKAGELSYLDHVDEAHRQEVIDLVRDRIESNPESLEKLGFGESADDLDVGAKVDIEALNKIAEDIAKEKGWYTADVPTADVPEQGGAAEAGSGAESAQGQAKPESSGVNEKVAQHTITFADGSTLTVENTVKVDTSLEGLREFANSRTGGYAAFDKKFTNEFVSSIETARAERGFFDWLTGAPQKDSTVVRLGDMTVGEYDTMVKADTYESYAEEHNVPPEDAQAWVERYNAWLKAGLISGWDANDRFDTLARAVYAAELANPEVAAKINELAK